MTIYAIGDIQGCFDEFIALLDKISFDSRKDKLWICGDLVNRGPKSLETLRYIKSLGDCASIVLGNHDLHLLAIVYANIKQKSYDTLEAVLTAPDCLELCEWLRHCPLLLHEDTYGFTMVHAGIFPKWTLAEAMQYAREVEVALRGDNYIGLFKNMYGNSPYAWDPKLISWDRLRFIINCFTRMRLCGPGDRLNLKYKGPPTDAPQQCIPWFQADNRVNRDIKIIFGHWAALDCKVNDPNLYPLDSGCVWGRCLTALRLDNEERITVDCLATRN